jgi:ABC-2 type transport system permease protein
LFMALMALLFTALGTALAALMSDFQGFQLIMNFLVMPTFFLSGALYPLRDLPWALDMLVTINPMTYAVDGLRGALTGVGYFNPVTDLAVLAGVAACLIALGGYLFSRIQL